MNAFNARFASPSARWKISDDVRLFNGRPIIERQRKAYVPQLLLQQYRLLVQQRHRSLVAMSQHTFDRICDFLTNPATRPSLLLYGTTGTGKSTYLTAIFRLILFLYDDEVRRGDLSVRYVKASDLGRLLKNDKPEFLKVRAATCLFIDDLGFSGECEMVNDYGVRAKPVEDIIEYRYDAQLMTACTSNLSLDDIRLHYGPRVFSRMLESFALLPLTGDDFRSL